MNEIIKHALKTALVLVGFALIYTAILSYVEGQTRAPIAKAEADARLALLKTVVPDALHDNDLLKDTLTLAPDALLGTKQNTEANRISKGGQPVGVILEAIAPDGYSGAIKLLIAIKADGSIVGVRVLTHKETPGLGDYIEIARSSWIKQFDGKAKTEEARWKVKKDDGEFDYVTGATITPRAIIKAVYKALQYFEAHQAQLLAGASA